MPERGGPGSAKELVERVLLVCGPAGLARRRHRTDCAILAYHNVVPIGDRAVGDRSLHLPQRRFGEQLDALLERFPIVPLDDLDGPDADVGPRVAITFDDAYAGAVTAGAEELAARGLPARVFVVPGLLGRRSFWWDRLADPDSGAVPPAVRRHALWALGGDDRRIREELERDGIASREPPDHALSATAEELDAALRNPTLSLGSHGWSHSNLAAQTRDAAERELVRSAAWLRERYGARHASSLSYPYGLRSAGVIDSVSAVYGRAFRIDGGLARPEDVRASPHDVPRVNVPAGISAPGLLLRASGLGRGTGPGV